MSKTKTILFLLVCLLGFSITVRAEVTPGLVKVLTKKGYDDRGKYNFQYPALTDKFSDDTIRNKVNALIQKEVVDDRYCEADAANKTKMESTTSTKILIATADILSFQVHYNYYCAGPYPDEGIAPYLFDLKTGEEVNLEDQVADVQEFKNIVTEKFLASPAKNSETDCADLYTKDQLLQASLKYFVTDKYLGVSQDYPHAVQACAYTVEIPYSEIKALVKPGSLLETLINNSN